MALAFGSGGGGSNKKNQNEGSSSPAPSNPVNSGGSSNNISFSFTEGLKNFVDNAPKSETSNPINTGTITAGISNPNVSNKKEERETFANDSGGGGDGGGGSTPTGVVKVRPDAQPGSATQSGTGSHTGGRAVGDGSFEAQKEQERQQAEAQRQAELASQEAVRKQQELVAQSQPAPVSDAVAQADASVSAIQEQLNIARNNNDVENILRLTEDLLQAQKHRNELDAQARAVVGKGTTVSPLVGTPQAVDNEYTQSANTGNGNVLANDIVNNLKPNDTRKSAFVKNAGRAVQEDEDEFWTGGNPLREAIDRVNSGNLRATDQTYGRPVNGTAQPTTSVYDVNPTLKFSSGNPVNNGAISRDQLLEATSSLFSPLANFGVPSAEASYPYHPNVVPVGTQTPAPSSWQDNLGWGDVERPNIENDVMAQYAEKIPEPQPEPEPQYTYDDYYNMVYQNARRDGATAREAAIIADEGAKQWLDYDATVTPTTFSDFVKDIVPNANIGKWIGALGGTLTNSRNEQVLGRTLGTAGKMLGDVASGIIDSDSRRRYGTDFKENLPYTPADTSNILNSPSDFQAGINLAIQDANNEKAIEQALDAGVPLAEVTKMSGYERAEKHAQPEPRPTTKTPKTTTPATTTPKANTDYSGNPINTTPYSGTPQASQGGNDLALESAIRRGETTYEQVYNDYVNQNVEPLTQRYLDSGRYATEAEARQAATDTARRQAYNKIYDLGFRSDFSQADVDKYGVPSLIDFRDALEKSTGNNFYTNEARPDQREFNLIAGGTDRSYDQDRLFYDLTSELAGNAYANATRGTNYNTTPNILNPNDVSNPLNLNGALQAGLSGALNPDQILHFYDANYSDINVPESTQKWLASDSTHALQELYLNNGKNIPRLEKEHGTEEEFNKAMQDFLNANPSLKLLKDEGALKVSDIANNFFKARIDEQGNVTNPYAGTGDATGKTLYLNPSHGQGGTVVKAPYRKGGYTEAELIAMGNNPYKDRNGYDAYEGYYQAPDGSWYPVDQEKANYYNRYGTYRGWDEGMRDYYNTFGTFSGYTPNWKNTGKKSSGGGRSYYRGGNSYSGNGYYSNSLASNYQPYSYSNSASTPQYANQQRAGVSPTTSTQRSNRIYNIMKNWSF